MELIIPAFIAGLLTFLAPCTLPLVPGYLAFISGTDTKTQNIKEKVFKNGLAFVAGFSLVFILLGVIAGLLGSAFAPYQTFISYLAGILIIIFGLFITGILDIPFFQKEKRINLPPFFKRGTLKGSFLFGSAFSLGWTPCVGPVLGSVLILASSTTTVLSGAILLGVFALGLAVPFLLVAATIDQADKYIKDFTPYLRGISILGGIFLIIIGAMVLTNNMPIFLAWVYSIFEFIGYDRLLDHL